MSTYSLREQIADTLVQTIQTTLQPSIRLVTREPFEPTRIAITDFPAVLVELSTEERLTVTMGMGGAGRRQGTMVFSLRGYVRGVELDKQRNELITSIETVLDQDRYLGLFDKGVLDSQVIHIEIIKMNPPLAQILIQFQVKYNYLRGEA